MGSISAPQIIYCSIHCYPVFVPYYYPEIALTCLLKSPTDTCQCFSYSMSWERLILLTQFSSSASILTPSTLPHCSPIQLFSFLSHTSLSSIFCHFYLQSTSHLLPPLSPFHMMRTNLSFRCPFRRHLYQVSCSYLVRLD